MKVRSGEEDERGGREESGEREEEVSPKEASGVGVEEIDIPSGSEDGGGEPIQTTDMAEEARGEPEEGEASPEAVPGVRDSNSCVTDDSRADLEPSRSVSPQEVGGGEEPAVKRNFHFTALSVFSGPSAKKGAPPLAPVLVSGVTVIRDGRATPTLMLHTIKPSQKKRKSKSAAKQAPPPPVIPDDSLLDWNLDLDVPLSTSIPPLGLPPPLPLPLPDSLLDISDSTQPKKDPLPAVTHMESAVSLKTFTQDLRAGGLPVVQHILPLLGTNLLVASVTCTKEVDLSSKSVRGGLVRFSTVDSNGCPDIYIKYIRTLTFDSEGDVVVSMCEMVGVVPTEGPGQPGNVLAVLNQRGEVVLYDRDLVVLSRYSPEGGHRGTSVTFCPPLGQLAVATAEGKVLLLRLAGKGGEQRELQVDGESLVRDL